ncbi:hypothetical protein BY996DRAFT_642436 [Phakopsora pachyrhizi]|nr:hypothetical protein BY996DRAFT_642436 [Phakopsora pachyrhizi]
MPRPQSHYSSSNRNLDGLDPRLLNQFRSTSLDHSRQPIPLTPPSPTSPDRSVPLSTTKDSRQNTQTLTVRVPSDLSRAAKSDHAESLLVSSSPSTYRSGTTSETSTSIGIADMAQVNAQTQNLTQEQLINSPISDKEQQHLSINGTDPGQATKRSSRSSLRPSDGEDARSGTGSSVTSGSTPRAAPTSQLSSSSTIKEVGAMDGEVQNYSPAEVLPTLSVSQENGQDVLGDVSQSTDEQELDSQMAEKNQKRKVVTQAEIDQAPELKDVEVGDLMFANMLNLSGDSGKNGKDFVEKQLGPWRFGDPTTDILEDNTFVFLNKSVDVQKRRKFFSEGNGKHRKSFTYDPDVVYATSFFSPFMDFNTFDLAIGPVKMNVSRVLGDMPIRYTLRSTRIEKRRRLKKVREEKIVEEHMNVNSDGGAGSEDGGAKSGGRTKGDETSGISEDNGNESKLNNHVDYDDEKEEEEEIREEEIFVTIAFELVD